MSALAKANQLVEQFLNIKYGELCPSFGFNHNPQPMLLAEAITSFLAFHLLLAIARLLNRQLRKSRHAKKHQPPKPNVDSVEELEKFSTMIDRSLNSMTRIESGSLSMGQHTATERDFQTKLERPRDIELLREEFKSKIAAVKNKWETEPPEEEQPLPPQPEPDEIEEFRATAGTVVVYWALQAILCCVVMGSIGVSLLRMGTVLGVWPHYCLLVYSVSNTGMLPTGCLSLCFILDWFFFEGITTTPVQEVLPEEPSYEPVGNDANESGAEEPKKRQRTTAEVSRHLHEVADLRQKFIWMCLPELVPLAFMLVTHTVPFLFMFLWLTIAVLVVLYLSYLAVKGFAQICTSQPRSRMLRQAQVLMFLAYIFITMYIHTSVQVMTRVFAGEWRHGGFFDSLWWHLILDTDALTRCPWTNAVRWVDLPLRWA